MAIIPATKILNDTAPGFYFEALICGEKCTPLPLGGMKGLLALFECVKQIPAFANVLPFNHGIDAGDNITLSTVGFAERVSFIFTFIVVIANEFHFYLFIYRYTKLKTANYPRKVFF